jgi:hypothetical protein
VLLLSNPRNTLPLVRIDAGELTLDRPAQLIDRIGDAFEIPSSR